MSAVLKRRLEKIEAVAMQPPAPKVRMLFEPLEGASEAEREQYARNLAEAKAKGEQVIIISPLKALERKTHEDGCRIVGSEAEAALCAAALQPSTTGRRNALEDMLPQILGRVHGVVENPPP